jgi:hypothetical protein
MKKTLTILALALGLGGCAATKLAETQCGAAQELRAAGMVIAGQQASAVACEIQGNGTATACEETAGLRLASEAASNGTAIAEDVEKCAAALISDVASGKAK